MNTRAPACVRLRSAILLAFVVLPAAAAPALGSSADWTGTWDTNWIGGGTRMVLLQEGSVVTGSCEPGAGVITGTVEGSYLRGRWTYGSRTGAFDIDMSGDGGTFFGHLDNGDWWSGIRAGRDRARDVFVADRRSPQAVLRSFLVAANAIRAGRREYIHGALDCLAMDGGQEQMFGARASDRPILYFDVLDLCTVRLADLPVSVPADSAALTLRQAGTSETYTVRARRTADGWKLDVPSEDELRASLRRLMAARGEAMINPPEHLELRSPRATMRTFLEEFKKWDHGGRARVAATLDLSEINEPLRETMLPLLATYLKQTLDRVGYVIWQEVPDDPNRTLPYVHFQHPRGSIAIAPVQQDSVMVWKFTARTLADVRSLYETLEDVPLASSLIPDQQQAAYFRLNQLVRRTAPSLTGLLWGLEQWQWLAIAASLLLTALVAALIGGLALLVIDRGLHRLDAAAKGRLRIRLLVPAALTLAVAVGYACVTNIGLPLTVFPFLHGFAVVVIGVGLTLTVLSIVNLVQENLHERAARTAGYYDELMVALLGSAFKAFVVVFGVALLAREIGIPVTGVVAGLGVGGFAIAFAAKDTLANLLGSAVILADRPFARGDLIAASGHEGYVKSVGLRSTQIRTREDSLVSIPNSLLANASIDNLGRRRQRRIKSRIGVRYDTPPAMLDAIASGLLETMRSQPQVRPLYLSAGVWEFAESSIDLEFSCYVDVTTHADEHAVRHALFLDIARMAEKLGVEFAFPTRTVHLPGTAVPAEGTDTPDRTGAA